MRLFIIIKVDELKKIIAAKSCIFVSNIRFILSNCLASQAQHIYLFLFSMSYQLLSEIQRNTCIKIVCGSVVGLGACICDTYGAI